MASLVIIGMLSASACASALSVPVKAAVKGYEKAAVKLGIRTAEKAVVRGGSKLAAVTAEHEVAKSAAHGTIKAVCREVTGKKMLAAGAAAAMVVAAHEMSDGIQEGTSELGKGIGKAAECHPEIAGGIVESIMSPIRYLAIAGMLVVMAVVAWFLWPFVLLARNARDLALIRKAAAMKEGTVVDVTPLSAYSAGTAFRSGFTRVELLFAVSALLVLTILGVWRMAGGRGAGAADGETRGAVSAESRNAGQDAKVAKRTAAIAKLHAEYDDALKRHYGNFLSEVQQVVDVQFDAVRAKIPGVVAQYGTFSRCKDLFKTIVMDKIKGGNETGNGIRRDLEAEYYRGLYAARDKVNGCIVSFLSNAESAREKFRVELGTELDASALPGDDAYKALLEKCGDEIEQKKVALKWGQIDAGIASVFEAICVRQTVAAVAKLLGRAAIRQAGTTAAGATAAVADGPLPIGDVVGGAAIVGCTAWSAYDVWKATKILPDALRSTLESATQKCEWQTLEEAKQAGKTIYKALHGALLASIP